MKKIGVISDIHGNLQALESILEDIESRDLYEVICLGDTIAIGPNPRECLELILDNNIKLVLGNHEEYFIEGAKKFVEVGVNERAHQKWVSSQMSEDLRLKLKDKPFIVKEEINGLSYAFMHYARKNDKFIYTNEERNIKKLNQMFSNVDTDVVFYGHEHDLEQTKVVGDRTYICVGSSGCRKDRNTYYTILTVHDNTYRVEKVNLQYDRDLFESTLNGLNYPDKEFITKTFFGLNCEK